LTTEWGIESFLKCDLAFTSAPRGRTDAVPDVKSITGNAELTEGTSFEPLTLTDGINSNELNPLFTDSTHHELLTILSGGQAVHSP
jgi:hypothetical protein